MVVLIDGKEVIGMQRHTHTHTQNNVQVAEKIITWVMGIQLSLKKKYTERPWASIVFSASAYGERWEIVLVPGSSAWWAGHRAAVFKVKAGGSHAAGGSPEQTETRADKRFQNIQKRMMMIMMMSKKKTRLTKWMI